ncbi:MAG TPA: hypothetical protein VGG64_20885 [Pirellulales bacterium]|jgi:hypothetical protein
MAEYFAPDLGNLTATAILGWYAWHNATRTIPELLTAFRQELATTRSESREERETLRDELNAERIERHSDHMAIVEALHELAERLRKSEHAPPASTGRKST